MSTLLKRFASIFAGFALALFVAGPGIAQGQTVEELQAQIQQLLQTIAQLQAQLAALQGQQPQMGGGLPAACVGITSFDRNLTIGSRGADVRCWQALLNTDPGTLVASSGPGSPGQETMYFGPLTADATKRFQEKYADEILAPLGLTSGTGFFGPSTRAKANQLLQQLAQQPATPSTPEEMPSTPEEQPQPEPEAEGGWEFTNLSNPEDVILAPTGAQGIEFLRFKIRAQEDGTLESLAFKRVGVGTTSDFGRFFLFKGDTRITNGRRLNSETHLVTFSNLDLQLQAGQEVELALVGSISSGAASGRASYFRVDSADAGDIDTSNLVGIRGPAITVATVSTGTVQISSSGTLENPTLGEVGARLARFRLRNTGGEDVVIQRLILEQTGSIDPEGLDNLVIRDSGGNIVASSEGIQVIRGASDLATFIFDPPFELEQGDSEIFTVFGDVTGAAQTGDTIRFQVETPLDLLAVGQDYGFGAQVVDTAPPFPATFQSLTVEGGQVTFNFMNSPTTRSVLAGGSDIHLLDFNVTAEERAEITSFPVVLYADDDGDGDPFDGAANAALNDASGLVGATQNNLRNIRVIDRNTGNTVMGPEELSGTNDASEVITFTDPVVIEPGQTLELALVVDVDSNMASGTEIGADLDLDGSSGTLAIEDINGDPVTDIVPNSDIRSNVQTVTTSSLNVGLNSTPTSDDVIAGTDDFTALGLRFTAGDASDVTITSLTLTAYVDDNGDGNFGAGGEGATQASELVASVRLVDSAGNQQGSARSVPSTGGAIVFDDLNFTVPAGGVATLFAVVDVVNNAPAGKRFAFDIANASDVVAQDSEGDNVSLSLPPFDPPNDCDNTCDIFHTVRSAGTLAISAAGDTPDSQILLTGQDGVELAAFDFDVLYEDFVVQRLTLEVKDAGASPGGVTDVFGDVFLYDAQGNLLQQGSFDASGKWILSNETDGLFTASEDFKLIVKADITPLNKATGAGADSGDRPYIRLLVDTAGAGDPGVEFKAVGVSSGTTITDENNLGTSLVVTDNNPSSADTDVAGDEMLVRNAKPVVTENAIASVLQNGSGIDLLSFNVSSATGSGDDVYLKQVVIELTLNDSGADVANNLTVSNFRWKESGIDKTSDVEIRRADNGNDLTANSIAQANGTSGTYRVVVIYKDGKEPQIPAGSSKSFTLSADLSNVDIGDDSITTRLLNDLVHISNNYTSYFVGSDNVNSRIYLADDGANKSVFYDVDGDGKFTATDVELGNSGASAAFGTTGTQPAGARIIRKQADGTEYQLVYDVNGDTTAGADTFNNTADDIVLATDSGGFNPNNAANDESVSVVNLRRVSAGSDFGIFDDVDNNFKYSSATEDLLAGSTGVINNNTEVFGGWIGSGNKSLNFIWSDDSAPLHSTNSPDWTNGYLVNQPDADLDDISHTLQ